MAWDRKLVSLVLSSLTLGCSVIATRPIQEMSDTAAAIRAAKEVQADTLAPELFRQSNEWFFRAKHEYKFKGFYLAKQYAEKARTFAEQAEYEAIRSGGNRSEAGASDPLANGAEAPGGAARAPGAPENSGPPTADPLPTPEGTPAADYDQRKADEDAAKKKAQEDAAKAAAPTPVVVPPVAAPVVPVKK